MDDKQIINLFFQRDEDAINAVDEKYGSKLNALAANMLQSREDGLECVNDTYMKAWNSIPPARPEYLFAFLAASARNIAIDMIRKNNAGKRQAKVVELTKELEECKVMADCRHIWTRKILERCYRIFLKQLIKIKELYFSGGTGTRIQLKIFQKGCR